jgi:hypothetical protein
MDAWAEDLGCSREALARGLGRMTAGQWRLERLLRAMPEAED